MVNMFKYLSPVGALISAVNSKNTPQSTPAATTAPTTPTIASSGAAAAAPKLPNPDDEEARRKALVGGTLAGTAPAGQKLGG